MHNTTETKKDKLGKSGSIDPNSVARGHRPHKSGAGGHKDKRRKTRNVQRQEWSNEK